MPETTAAPIRVSPPCAFNFNAPEEWPVWSKRFGRYLSISGLESKSDKEKIDLFCYCAGEKAEEILKQVIPSASLETATFATVSKAFDEYFHPKKNIVFERAKFNARVQAFGEPVDEFITALHTLRDKCEYGTLRDELIRDRIVIGLQLALRSLQSAIISSTEKCVAVINFQS
ncbi:uncharacterized protein LOC112905573 [Agrilus planipennis]|uniref:Uncharacterized protein LOC112905573 n=1 Tax=Agrilus planipennis TaxID=224129 RepID=A0A7F5RDM3_AGRPL|nr:uncharacterized protein LOC112905573 [Agrilus planipennis]